MQDVVPAGQLQQARRLKQLLSTYEHHRDLIAIGAYQNGSDPRIDAAIAAQAGSASSFIRICICACRSTTVCSSSTPLIGGA